jgi:hypothetical protein
MIAATSRHSRRPSPAVLARAFEQQTGLPFEPPPVGEYTDDSPSPPMCMDSRRGYV